MDFTVTTKGPTLESLTRDTSRELRAANRTAGRAVAKVGKAAIAKGAPRMFGRTLAAKAEVDSWPTRCTVEFNPARGQAGAWQIQESGRRGGYIVKPRKRDALAFPGAGRKGSGFAMSGRPSRWGGRKAWSRAVARLATAVDRTVADVYDDALGV